MIRPHFHRSLFYGQCLSLLSLFVLSCSQDPHLLPHPSLTNSRGRGKRSRLMSYPTSAWMPRPQPPKAICSSQFQFGTRSKRARFTFPVRWSLLGTPTRLILLTSAGLLLPCVMLSVAKHRIPRCPCANHQPLLSAGEHLLFAGAQ